MFRTLAVSSLSALSLAAAVPACGFAATAPGRIAFSVSARVANVDARGAGPSVALPDGGAVLVTTDRNSFTAVRLRADGSMEPAFGAGGIARFAVPGGVFSPAQLLRQPDGRLLVVGSRSAAAKDEGPRFLLVRLTATGALDASFGGTGFVAPELQAGGAALAPDGSIVLTGNTGKTAFPAPGQAPTFRWVVQRLTAGGSADAAFGSVLMPGQTSSAVVVRPAGQVVALGSDRGVPKLAGLTAAGAPDPAFGAGLPATAGDGAFQMALRASGAIDVLGRTSVLRYTPAGTLDAAFGAGGSAAFGGPTTLSPALLPTADGGALVYWTPGSEPTPPGSARLHLERLTAAGARGGAADLSPSFGGGVSGRAFTNISPAQNAFRDATLLARPNGSLLAVGGLSIQRYTGEGTGFSLGVVAVAGLTATLAPDTSFGGPQELPILRVSVSRQSARSSLRFGGMRVGLSATGAGLVRLRVRDARRRILAETVEPIFSTRATNLRIPLTTTGRRLLHGGHTMRVFAGYDFHDVLTGRARGETPGRLR
jgi:uncharacterized delta-60 repeat protein